MHDTSYETHLDMPPSLAEQLKTLARALGRFWKAAGLLILASVLVAGVVTLVIPRTYQATNTSMVVAAGGNTLGNYSTADSLAMSKADSYRQIGTSPEVAAIAAEDLDGIDVEGVSFDLSPGTAQIRVNGQAATPEDAARVADAYAAALASEVDRIESMMSEGTEYQPPSDVDGADGQEEVTGPSGNVVELIPVSSATEPSGPHSPNLRTNLLIGLGAGLVLSILYVLGRYVFDRKVRSSDAAEKATGIPVMGTIPTDSRLSSARQLVPVEPHRKDKRGWATSEAIRQLRTNLTFSNVDDPPRSILMTSSMPGEGKSSLAANLAVALGAAGIRTLVIDADLRRSVQTEMFGLPSGAGLTDVLAGAAELEDVIQEWRPGAEVFVLAAGRTPPNPSELLGSRSMRELIQALSEEFTVIIDSPPLLPVTDAAVLATSVDGTVVVAQANRTNLDHLHKAVNRLRSLHATALGTVLNQVPRRGSSASQYDYYSDTYYYLRTQDAKGRRTREKRSAAAPAE